jgi:peptidoglycan/LPS O-acetylase OafA/YrhL
MTVTVPAPPTAARQRRARLHRRTSATGRDRIDSLDGLRAFALLIIMGYHFGIPWLQGGFFSLDIFYVLSGYLITGLLLGEYARRGAIAFSAFWLRRARRLLPALLVVLVAVTVLIRFGEPAGLYPGFRMDALSALFYFSNWWQIAASGNYFVATGAVSPLTHTWSLAVEEQFYLVWPLVTFAVLRLSRTFARGLRVLLVLSLVGAAGSALEMALLYHPTANITRLYFGTDTHAQSILVGAALACILTMVQRRRGEEGMAPVAGTFWRQAALTVLGLAGFAGTLAITVEMQGTSSFDYLGGFLVSALSAAGILVAAITVRGGLVSRFLSLRPLVWFGTVSYGAYLWHYPIFIELNRAHTGLTGLPLLAARTAATVVLAAASFYLIERPVMERAFWRTARAAVPSVALVGVTVAVVVAGTVVPAAGATVALGPGSLPTAERQALTTDGAFGAHPVRFLLVGDSLAVTMGVGLQVRSVPNYGVQVINKGVLGCDLDGGRSIVSGTVATAVSACVHWPSLWAHDIATYHPEVVGVMLGRWLITDHLPGGHEADITQPAWRAHLKGELNHVMAVLSAGGAHVVLLTMPYISPVNVQPNGSAWPENRPVRVNDYNSLLHTVAAQHPATASVFDLNRILDPAGRFQQTIDGVAVRWPDGIHISKAGGEWLQHVMLPSIAEAGLKVRASEGL